MINLLRLAADMEKAIKWMDASIPGKAKSALEMLQYYVEMAKFG